MGNLTLCLAVSTAIPLPFARTENVQTLNPSTFESEMRADNENQVSFVSIFYPKAERSYIFDSTRKTCMISGPSTWNKKSEVWEVVSCVSTPLVHPLYYSLTSPNILAVCGDSRLFCASFTVGCQKGEIPALRALSWRILFCISQSKAKPVSVSSLQISCRVQRLSFAYRCSLYWQGLSHCLYPLASEYNHEERRASYTPLSEEVCTHHHSSWQKMLGKGISVTTAFVILTCLCKV